MSEQRFSDMEWKAKRYDYLLTNDSEAVWQAERELQVMRERVAELEAAAQAVLYAPFLATWPPGSDDLVFVRLRSVVEKNSSASKEGR